MSGTPLTEKNAANKVASLGLWYYLVEMKQPPPHVMARSHNHRYADSGNNFDIFAVCLPAFTLATEYVYRIGKENVLADIGLSVFMCESGKFEHRSMRYKPEVKKVWGLKV